MYKYVSLQLMALSKSTQRPSLTAKAQSNLKLPLRIIWRLKSSLATWISNTRFLNMVNFFYQVMFLIVSHFWFQVWPSPRNGIPRMFWELSSKLRINLQRASKWHLTRLTIRIVQNARECWKPNGLVIVLRYLLWTTNTFVNA